MINRLDSNDKVGIISIKLNDNSSFS